MHFRQFNRLKVDNSSARMHTGSTSHWVEQVEDSSLTHTGSISHWVEQVEDSSIDGGTHWINITLG